MQRVGHLWVSTSSGLFHWSICLSLWNVKLGCCLVGQVPPSSYSSETTLLFFGPLPFHFRVSLSMSTKNYIGTLMDKTSNLEIKLGKIGLFIISSVKYNCLPIFYIKIWHIILDILDFCKHQFLNLKCLTVAGIYKCNRLYILVVYPAILINIFINNLYIHSFEFSKWTFMYISYGY